VQHHGEPGREIRNGRLLRAGRTAALPSLCTEALFSWTSTLACRFGSGPLDDGAKFQR
jgi:hypothetical protein